MGSSGLLRPTLVQFHTWGGGPTMEGPSLVGILGLHSRFGHLSCGLHVSASFSIGSRIKLGVSSTNPSSCTIFLCNWVHSI